MSSYWDTTDTKLYELGSRRVPCVFVVAFVLFKPIHEDLLKFLRPMANL